MSGFSFVKSIFGGSGTGQKDFKYCTKQKRAFNVLVLCDNEVKALSAALGYLCLLRVRAARPQQCAGASPCPCAALCSRAAVGALGHNWEQGQEHGWASRGARCLAFWKRLILAGPSQARPEPGPCRSTRAGSPGPPRQPRYGGAHARPVVPAERGRGGGGISPPPPSRSRGRSAPPSPRRGAGAGRSGRVRAGRGGPPRAAGAAPRPPSPPRPRGRCPPPRSPRRAQARSAARAA